MRNKRPVLFGIDPSKLEALKALAAARGTTYSALIREAVDRFLAPVPEPLPAVFTTREYGCGCTAKGPGDVPLYCPEHGTPQMIEFTPAP
jgi:hypothetical protein